MSARGDIQFVDVTGCQPSASEGEFRHGLAVTGMNASRAWQELLLLLVTVVSMLITGGFHQTGQAEEPNSDQVMIPEATRERIDKALEWLAEQQDPRTGAFGSREEYSQNVGVTALCGLAFLASGSTPDRGPYGKQVTAVTDYLLSCKAPNGYIVESQTKSHGPMYGHGFAVMFLAEVYGMSDRPDVRAAVKQGVQLIIDTQNPQGGWRYFPVPQEADISVTVCEVMALRAARNAGIAVPKETIDRAVNYIRLCQVPEDGGFRYRALEAAESRFPRSAAAIVALYTAGITDDPILISAEKYLRRHLPGDPLRIRDAEYYFYGEYYAVQAAWHVGGDLWNKWYPAASEELLAQQTGQGNWQDTSIGPEYATAMALIVLQLPDNYLPIFQR